MAEVRALGIERGTEVKVRQPGTGERGVWKVLGEVANSGPDDPAYDVTHTRSGRHRIFRGSRLVVLPARPAGRGQMS